MGEMLRGGRGGQVRLKTYLSMIWLAANPPHDVQYPARAWATLLDLPDPEGRGARRVNEAIGWLESHAFVGVEMQPGHPNRVTLLNELGDGRRYRVPGDAYNRAQSREADPEVLARHRYVRIPPTFWTNGWMATLSAAALAMYMVLLVEDSGSTKDELWFSPNEAQKRYAISDDTRSKGLNELRRAGVITVQRRPIASDVFDVMRFRNTYSFLPDALQSVARIPEKPSEELADF
ncbi:hypothetical protein [Nocardioides sp. 503]|uniref:hypothetical protein n=1 Tax=Nocardioides sp. 503 TaxID=2508326 RepID=UPI00106F64D8|nr:hypothetical protein [Nocardioides sp. 503]